MLNIFAVEGYVMLAVVFIAIAVKVFAFVNALLWPAEAYHAANKLTKPAWVGILGVALAAQLLLIDSSPLNLLHLIGSIAAIVYLVDVRPAVQELTRR
ncbi:MULTISPECIES: DUF2516 family protein [unclassified Nocardioides]|uniref:DUF2516 family protein n=1 Tax=unclassified Nocardioides TaxID=2615069 RepID=UPI0006FBD9B2|nr:MULTISPECIES: DUF2516 family protein [unclassified Nocardioides]KQY50911.1 hypothetical protein ASD30_20720 [Nocardioides sp. Root140]KQZ75598.1 hypothetical protein ASD66_04435 [Nocardioides sp. Root151]KRF14666.1 hypothetical protein ASH02_10190 [Nocardioides sp. Soil796]